MIAVITTAGYKVFIGRRLVTKVDSGGNNYFPPGIQMVYAGTNICALTRYRDGSPKK